MDSESHRYDHILDVWGLLCPMPIMKAAEKMKTMQPGEVLLVVATDNQVEQDFPAWCKSTGNELIAIVREGKEFKVFLRVPKV